MYNGLNGNEHFLDHFISFNHKIRANASDFSIDKEIS